MDQCFKTSCGTRIEITKPSISNLNSILVDSKGREETLVSETTSCQTRHVLISIIDREFYILQANLAGWEPGHGQFMFRHPWKQYLKIGNLTRQCACRLEPINGYLNSEFQVYLKHFLLHSTMLHLINYRYQ